MTVRIPVHTELRAYRVAAAELPGATRMTDHPHAAIAVLAGSGDWWRAAERAADSGARAIVVDEPSPASADAHARARATDVPLVVSRSRLRSDVVADALGGRGGTAPRALSVDAAAPDSELDMILRDAVGWARTLSDAPLVVAASRSNDRGVSALLEGAPGGAPNAPAPLPVCTLAVAVVAAVDLDVGAGWLRIDALAEVRTEIVVDAALGGSFVTTSSAAGRLDSPRRYETTERLALRRALAALHDGITPADLADLAHDDAIAAAL